MMSDHHDRYNGMENLLGTNLSEVGTDCISRQDALEAFGLSEKTRKYGGDHSGYDTMMMYEIQDTIENLPPLQPKITHCKDCKHWIFDGVMVCERFTDATLKEDDFCSYGER